MARSKVRKIVLVCGCPVYFNTESLLEGLASTHRLSPLCGFQLGMGQQARCLGIESILLNYRDEIFQLPRRLSTRTMEGKL